MPTSRKRKRSGSSRGPASVRPRPGSAAHRGSGNPGVTRRRKARFGDWIRAARPMTLGLSIAPIPVGFGAAVIAGESHIIRTIAALGVAICLQIGVNFANDYSDGIRGTDAHRVGPARLTASGMAKPRAVLTVALLFFLLAAIAGVGIVLITQEWWLLAAGALAILAAWFYTGGKWPYGYFGLGEVMVFLFFGLAAVLGTTYINAGIINQEAWFGAIGVGAFATAALVANNLRDIKQDRVARKFTLSVLIGPVASKILYLLLALVAPFAVVFLLGYFYSGVMLAYFVLLALIPAVIILFWGKTASEMVLVLKLTSVAALGYGLALGLGLTFAFTGDLPSPAPTDAPVPTETPASTDAPAPTETPDSTP